MITGKRFTLLILTMSFLVPVVAREAPESQTNAAPKLVIASPNHDFGQVKSGAPLSYSFRIKNEGKADLKIISVAPG